MRTIVLVIVLLSYLFIFLVTLLLSVRSVLPDDRDVQLLVETKRARHLHQSGDRLRVL